MKLLQINASNFGSTGAIMLGISKTAEAEGMYTYSSYANSRTNKRKEVPSSILIGNIFERNVHLLLFSITGIYGIFSRKGTRRLLQIMDRMAPDLIHLHNLHNCYINLPMLFSYIKRHNIPVVWTLHDCWAFTGQCPCFTIAKCDKWKTGCFDCSQYRRYPSSCVDRTQIMWKWKKRWFTSVKDMTIVTPSAWLADLVKQSFLNEYPVKVINNGIDLNVFMPTPGDFIETHSLQNKYIVLGVALGWGKRKGLDVFIELAKRLDEDYRIVLVGTDDATDKKLPSNIISIHRTENQPQLARIYTASDVFVNPTREENFPTVNIEALACGTPVLTFRTGGSPEIIDATCGSVVDCDDVDAMEREIKRICETRPYTKEDCLKRASRYDRNERFAEYVPLYRHEASVEDEEGLI